MMYVIGALPLVIHLAAAAISMQTFQSSDCSGDQNSNPQSNAANAAESSNCQASNQFNSVLVISADAGFQCNVFSDVACKNFVDTFQTSGTCSPVIGSGVICFSQAQFDNPLAGATAKLTVGTNILTIDGNDSGTTLVGNGTQTSCSDSECCRTGHPLTVSPIADQQTIRLRVLTHACLCPSQLAAIQAILSSRSLTTPISSTLRKANSP
jgi:hypothetical protein